ncbi:MAG: hypothetical protein JNL97_11130 [Verrucomicrobiales bacterium]|nr:hypothetical protein [Verrucomicrobiales bacterium]
MKAPTALRNVPACLAAFAAAIVGSTALAQTTTTQSLSLQAGWNAVWLEVEPRDAAGQPLAPEAVFLDPAITTIASFVPGTATDEFLADTAEASLNREGWTAWYRSDPARRSTLNSVLGNRPYLIRAASAVTTSLVGEASLHNYRWVPDAYNLVGFGLVSGSEPSFSQFFGPAGDRHPVGLILKLNPADGSWVPVSAAEKMTKNAAYWVYAAGNSTYQGPFRVDIRGGGELDYGSEGRDEEVLVFNESAAPANFVVDRVHPANGLELVHLVRDPAALSETPGSAVVNFTIGGVGARQSAVETFRARRDWTEGSSRRQLYRVASAGLGTYFWLPVAATRADLTPVAEASPSTEATGLWVGDIALEHVSQRVPESVATNRFEAVAAGPKARVILHVDAAGKVALLKQVTVMRTRSPEPTNVAQVLVLDPAKIPFFEGIERRGGKLVGKRVETTFYDLPRTPLPPEPLPANFDRAALPETYRTSLDLDGGMGPGRKCSTIPGTLVLDAWHRANPFRHAFHPAHATGYRVEREMSFVFDAPTTEAARAIPDYGREILVGDFAETLRGLVRPGEKIQVGGRFVLRRISGNATLE